MKCIRCGAETAGADLLGGRCPQCQGDFAFTAGRRDAFDDGAFLAAINTVSAGGTVKWNPDHLYYELCRRRPPKPVASLIGLVAMGLCVVLALGKLVLDAAAPQGGNAIAAATVGLGVAGVALAAVAAFAQIWRRRRLAPLSREQFWDMWDRWCRAHGRSPGVIEGPKHRGQAAADSVPELPVKDYTRAVICDRARLADVLLANNFHVERDCAVLAIGNHPPASFGPVRSALRRQEKLKVFALHDASPAGCRLAHKLAHDAAWFADQATVIDLGLRPRLAEAFSRAFQPAEEACTATDGIATGEAEWLSKRQLELAVIPPAALCAQLARALERHDAATARVGYAMGAGFQDLNVIHDDSVFADAAAVMSGASREPSVAP